MLEGISTTFDKNCCELGNQDIMHDVAYYAVESPL